MQRFPHLCLHSDGEEGSETSMSKSFFDHTEKELIIKFKFDFAFPKGYCFLSQSHSNAVVGGKKTAGYTVMHSFLSVFVRYNRVVRLQGFKI